MARRFRPPMFVVAVAMLGLIVLLAALQYRWLGQISDAERDRMRATLNARASGFARDFDHEITRAYLLFQADASPGPVSAAARLSARYDRWRETARFPRLIAVVYLVSSDAGTIAVQKYDVAGRTLEASELPAELRPLRAEMEQQEAAHTRGGPRMRAAGSMLLDAVPAIVVPSPTILLTHEQPGNITFASRVSYTVLVLDRQYISDEVLPALAEQHFRVKRDAAAATRGKDLRGWDDIDYQIAVVRASGGELIYRSAPDFTPRQDATSDASIDLLAVRLQEFSALAAEVRRFVTVTAPPPADAPRIAQRSAPTPREPPVIPQGARSDRLRLREPEVSIVLQQSMTPTQKTALAAGFIAAPSARSASTPKWKLVVKHPAGSLEAAVQAARRRNILVSTGILALLGVSMALLVLSTRRAQRLAVQQMEFVAAVSHELRTPLAVIRSAGENLADGVVRDDDQIRKYGDLVRSEGRRLTEMVEQILEFAGIQSGQRGFALRPVAVRRLLDDVVESSRALVDQAGMTAEIDVPETLPPVLGDEGALRRVFQNLVGNAIKYGAAGGWIGLRAEAAGREVRVAVSDRGLGIAPAEHARIFEPFYRAPDATAAQIHGAGLGLSLVKRIVEAHGGRVTVRSAPGQGSEFVVHLPVAGDEPLREDAQDNPARPDAHAAGVRP